jgi:hypothetical protein
MSSTFNNNTQNKVINILITLPALVVAMLLATGCTQDAIGNLQCLKSVLSPSLTAYAITGLGALNILINIVSLVSPSLSR